MEPAEGQFPPIELTVRGGQKLTFGTFSDLKQFWTTERTGFRRILENNRAAQSNPAAQTLQQVTRLYQSVDTLISEATQIISRYRGELNQVQKAEAQRLLAPVAERIVNALRSGYADTPNSMWLSSESKGKFVLELANASPDEAAYAFLHLRGADFESNLAVARNGVLKAQLFTANITSSRGDAEAAAIREITDSWRKETDRMAKEAAEVREKGSSLNEGQAKELAAQQAAAASRAAEFCEAVKKWSGENASLLKLAQENLEKLAATYDQHMKLQAPVDYWRKKKERHLAGRAALLRWTIGVGFVAFGCMAWFVASNFKDVRPGSIPYQEIVGFFVLSSIAFWAVRILVRLLLSSIHLAEDAGEREVMAMTYMALVRGDGTATKYIDEKDRALVLAPLFRPSSTGVIDDGAPPHISEIITKIGRR